MTGTATHLILISAIAALGATPAALARGGMGGGLHSHMGAIATPANPSVPPSLTPDPRLTGSAPLPSERPRLTANTRPLDLKTDAEDAKVDRMIKSICRGC